jgi:transglutaminase-like putative cysteine protease
MTVRVALRHRTHYRYDRLVRLGPQVVRLRPAPHSRTRVTSYSIRVSPSEHFENWQQDPHGNWLLRLVFPEKVRELELDVDLVLELDAINAFDFFLEPEADFLPLEYEPATRRELEPFLATGAGGPLIDDLVKSPETERASNGGFFGRAQSNDSRAHALRDSTRTGRAVARRNTRAAERLLSRFSLAARASASSTGPRGTLCLRLPRTAQARREAARGPAGPAEDFTDLHAWAEVYLPGAGWIGLDATSGLLTAEGHIQSPARPSRRARRRSPGSSTTASRCSITRCE